MQRNVEKRRNRDQLDQKRNMKNLSSEIKTKQECEQSHECLSLEPMTLNSGRIF